MKKPLKSHFPMIRSKEEIRLIIRENLRLEELFQSWNFYRNFVLSVLTSFGNFCTIMVSEISWMHGSQCGKGDGDVFGGVT